MSAETDETRAATWADAAATLNDHADLWERDGTDPCRVRVCREMADAFRTYAEGVGVPAIDSLRQKRAAAEAERDELRAKVAEFQVAVSHSAESCADGPCEFHETVSRAESAEAKVAAVGEALAVVDEVAFAQIATEKMLTIMPTGRNRAAVPAHWREEAEKRASAFRQHFAAALAATTEEGQR